MELVIDTNIIFSALLNSKAREYSLITQGYLNIVACMFSTIELFKHKEKLLKLSGIEEPELLENYYRILKSIQVIQESDIPKKAWKKAYSLCGDIDQKDTVYVAAGIMLDVNFWTGDKKLIRGLHEKGYDKTITTAELIREYDF